VAESRQIGGVVTFFETLGSKNTVNPDVSSTSEAQNHGIHNVFCLW